MNNKKRCKISLSKQSFSVHSFFVRPAIMGGANGVCGETMSPTFGTSGVQGGGPMKMIFASTADSLYSVLYK